MAQRYCVLYIVTSYLNKVICQMVPKRFFFPPSASHALNVVLLLLVCGISFLYDMRDKKKGKKFLIFLLNFLYHKKVKEKGTFFITKNTHTDKVSKTNSIDQTLSVASCFSFSLSLPFSL